MEQIVILAISTVSGVALTLFSVAVGFWMGKKTVRPEERVFNQEKITNDDKHILETPDYFEERLNREGSTDASIKTL